MPRKKRNRIIPKNNNDTIERTDYRIYNSIYIYLATAVNILLIFYIGFRSVIPTLVLISIYIGIPCAIFVILKRTQISRPALKAYCLGPTAFNLILLLNYMFSFNPINETYRFSRNSETVTSMSKFKTRSQMTSLITLENDAYDNYFGIRVFGSQEDIMGTDKITFTFKTGLLGIKVMTDYQFN